MIEPLDSPFGFVLCYLKVFAAGILLQQDIPARDRKRQQFT